MQAVDREFHDQQEGAQHSNDQVIVGHAISMSANVSWACRLDVKAAYNADHTIGAVYGR